MPLSAKTKNMLDLYGRLANENAKLTDFTQDVLEDGVDYAVRSDNWPVVAVIAAELAERQQTVA